MRETRAVGRGPRYGWTTFERQWSIMNLAEQKRHVRQQALACREAQEDRDGLSLRIAQRLLGLAAYQHARTVMLYIGVRHEVRTRHIAADAAARGRRVVVPFCSGRELGLFELRDWDELEPCRFGLWEPALESRADPSRHVNVSDLDLVIVPGVAFDRNGARLGYGRAYYDRLLRRTRPDATLVGLAFECQLFPRVPTGRRDVPMDLVITQCGVYLGVGRG